MNAKIWFELWAMAVREVAETRDTQIVTALYAESARKKIRAVMSERYGPAVGEKATEYFDRLREDVRKHAGGGR